MRLSTHGHATLHTPSPEPAPQSRVRDESRDRFVSGYPTPLRATYAAKRIWYLHHRRIASSRTSMTTHFAFSPPVDQPPGDREVPGVDPPLHPAVVPCCRHAAAAPATDARFADTAIRLREPSNESCPDETKRRTAYRTATPRERLITVLRSVLTASVSSFSADANTDVAVPAIAGNPSWFPNERRRIPSTLAAVSATVPPVVLTSNASNLSTTVRVDPLKLAFLEQSRPNAIVEFPPRSEAQCLTNTPCEYPGLRSTSWA